MIFFSNPSAQFKSYQSEIEDAALSVMRGNCYILGDQLSLLEKEFADYIGVTSSIGVANGTDAIEVALRALGVGQGDEVITVSHTAVATIAAIECAGANAVLVDVEPEFYTLNPNQLEGVLTPKTKAVVVVHLYGQSVNLDEISKFCNKNNLFLIEDASQAHGAKYKNKRLGSIGNIGCFSCYPTKNLGAIGDAGLITTNDANLAKKIRMIREYGWNDRISEYTGVNSRLDELQAAILRVKLKYLDIDNSKRRELSKFYTSSLNELPIQLPKIRENTESVFHLFVIQIEERKKLLNFFRSNDILAGIHYPVPVHLQPAYLDRIKTANDMSATVDLTKKIISLPIYPELPFSDAEKVVDTLKKFINQQ